MSMHSRRRAGHRLWLYIHWLLSQVELTIIIIQKREDHFLNAKCNAVRPNPAFSYAATDKDKILVRAMLIKNYVTKLLSEKTTGMDRNTLIEVLRDFQCEYYIEEDEFQKFCSHV